MALSKLPIELLFWVAKYLDFDSDINTLSQVTRRTYAALNRYLYQHNVSPLAALRWNGRYPTDTKRQPARRLRRALR